MSVIEGNSPNLPAQYTSASVAPFPANENVRVQALQQYEVLDTDPEQQFDDLAFLAASICGTPIALVSLVDKDRQWFKARVGLNVPETPRDVSFCAHAILHRELFVVPDASKDLRFENNRLVTGDPQIRFYAGMPLFSSDGQHPLGTMCVIDRVPRELTALQRQAIQALARQAQALLELRLLLRRERQLSRVDSLTGACNRRSFYENLERELSRLERRLQPFSIAYLDFDNLKRVNDEFGHEAGDAILSTVARTIGKHLRKTDTIARLGGDEFAILFSETGEAAARRATENILGHLMTAMKERGWPVTFSVGVLTCNDGKASAELVVKQADDLMYKVKNSGKNGTAHHTMPQTQN